MLVSFSLHLQGSCPACNQGMPINGIVSSIRCHHCNETAKLPAKFWSKRFDHKYAMRLADGAVDSSSTVVVNEIPCRLRYGKQPPRCQSCKAPPLKLESLEAAAAAGEVTCPECKHTIRVRKADKVCQALHRRAKFVVHESAEDWAARSVQAATRPIVFQCMSCQAGLPADGTSRTVTCKFCESPNFLPDGLWNQLHPVPKVQTFFLVCEYDEPSLHELRWEDTKNRLEDAQRADLSLELLTRLSMDGSSEVRLAIAHNPATPSELLAKLGGDREAEIRAAVVRHPKAPVKTLAELATRDRGHVLEAFGTRNDLPAEIAETLASSDQTEARLAATWQPALSHQTLRELTEDHDADVRAKALSRIENLKSIGVEVPGGGFFSKLFG